jgi:hypothetical protein
MKSLIPGSLLAALAVIAAAGCGSSGGSSTAPTTAAAGASGPAGSGAGSPSALAPVKGSYSPSIDPSRFSPDITNPYLPFKPGTSLHYAGVAEDGTTPQTDVETATSHTATVMGVECRVVHDVVSQGGHPIEKTDDWYAQDDQGNVWYMGEDARDLKHGRFVHAGDSWEGGVDGAQPGIIMPAHPQPGDAYRQEYYPGHAMDQARVKGLGPTVKVPAGTYPSPLITEERSALEPGVVEEKINANGVGVVKEHVTRGNHEEFRLVSITHG